MIKSLRGIAFRFFKENKLIALTSMIGVMISISLIITMVVFVYDAKASLIQEVEKMYGKMDLAVGYNPEQQLFIDDSLSEALGNQDGVKSTSEVFLTHYTVDELNQNYYTVGVDNDSLAKSRYHFTENLAADEVALNNGLAKLLRLEVGDLVSIEGSEFTVKEILPDLEEAGPVTDILLLNRKTIAQLEFEKTGVDKRADYMMFEVSEATDVYALAHTLQGIDAELRVDIAAEDEFLKSNLDLLFQFMIGLSILVILITALFIISNFELFLYKYKHELAILRAIGATRRQVFSIIVIQSAIINVVGGVSALLFSFGAYRYLQAILGKIFSVTTEALIYNFSIAILVAVISMGVIQLFMFIPAYRSSRLLPMTIMQENEELDYSHMSLRKKVGFSGLGFSLLFILIGVVFNDFRIFILGGSIGFLLSSILVVSLYLSKFMEKLLPIVRRVLGNIAFVSLKNTIPQVKKNTFIVLIISALMIIVVFGSTFIQTIQQSDINYIKKQYETEIVVTNKIVDSSEINAIELREDIKRLSSIKNVSTQSAQDLGTIEAEDGQKYADYSFADILEMGEQGLIETSVNNPDQIIVKESFADEYGLAIGDVISLSIESDNEQYKYLQQAEVVIADIVKTFPFPNEFRDLLIDWETSVFDSSFKTFDRVYVEAEDPALALAELEELKGIYPEIQVNSLAESLAQSKEMMAQRWIIFIVVLVVILLSVMFGVVNTLINNMNAKRKEFAVLRVVYLKPKNIIQVMMTQVTTYIALGVLLGTGLGVIFTYLVSLVDPVRLSFNYTLIAIIAVVVFILAYIVLVPFANRLGKLNISRELMQDNK